MPLYSYLKLAQSNGDFSNLNYVAMASMVLTANQVMHKGRFNVNKFNQLWNTYINTSNDMITIRKALIKSPFTDKYFYSIEFHFK